MAVGEDVARPAQPGAVGSAQDRSVDMLRTRKAPCRMIHRQGRYHLGLVGSGAAKSASWQRPSGWLGFHVSSVVTTPATEGYGPAMAEVPSSTPAVGVPLAVHGAYFIPRVSRRRPGTGIFGGRVLA